MTPHILVTCKACSRKLRAPANMIGRTANCPNCKSKVTIEETSDLLPSPSLSPRVENPPLGPPSPEEGGAAVPATGRERTARKEPYSADRIKSLVDKLDERRNRLVELHRGMTQAEIQDMVVDGHAMLVRGINQIDNFIDNASRALREAKSVKYS
jgi:hypothetical protein